MGCGEEGAGAGAGGPGRAAPPPPRGPGRGWAPTFQTSRRAGASCRLCFGRGSREAWWGHWCRWGHLLLHEQQWVAPDEVVAGRVPCEVRRGRGELHDPVLARLPQGLLISVPPNEPGGCATPRESHSERLAVPVPQHGHAAVARHI